MQIVQHATAAGNAPASSVQAGARKASSTIEASVLAARALSALLDEARLTPKPGLVDRRGNGTHHDLSLALLERSASTLGPFFAAMARASATYPLGLPLRETLGSIGRQAEESMRETTGGVNTHRGAIWTLGLLVAAGATGPVSAEDLCLRAGAIARLPDRFAGTSKTNGIAACSVYGVLGARGEAMAGFPHIRERGLPTLRRSRCSGCGEPAARLDCLLAIMTTLPDTCLLHRGGREALVLAQTGAARVLAAGGSASTHGEQVFRELDASLHSCWASPGGAADLLAGTLFVDRHLSEANHA